MRFQTDSRMTGGVGGWFGEYLITGISRSGQVRADLFRKRGVVIAHVSFPTGLDAGTYTDPYVSELRNYAREHGFADQFEVVYSEKLIG
jgi:hypothetical protein